MSLFKSNCRKLQMLIKIMISTALFLLFSCTVFAAETETTDRDSGFEDAAEGGKMLQLTVYDADGSTVLEKNAGGKSIDLLEWNRIKLKVDLVEIDEDGNLVSRESLVGVSGLEYVTDSTGSNLLSIIDSDDLKTSCTIDTKPVRNASSTTITIKHIDPEVATTSLKINIKKLKVKKSDEETVRNALFSILAYTHFPVGLDWAGKTIGDLLQDEHYLNLLQDQDQYLSKSTWWIFSGEAVSGSENVAKMKHLYSALLWDYKFVCGNAVKSFYACAFSKGNDTIIAYRGTDDLNDLIKTDRLLGLGVKLTEDFDYAENFYQSIKNRVSGTISVTGHSLGGGLANYIGTVYDLKSTTFNAPSTLIAAVRSRETIMSKAFKGLDYTKRTDYINAYDWVGHAGTGDNLAYPYGTANLELIIQALGVGKYMIRDAGLLDRTVTLKDNSVQSGQGGTPLDRFHGVRTLLKYDMKQQMVSMSEEIKSESTEPKSYNKDSYVALGSTGNDKLSASEYLYGGNGNDILTSTFSTIASSLSGITGSVLVGGEGDDTLYGSEGADIYYYIAGQGTDKIIDKSAVKITAMETDYGYNYKYETLSDRINIIGYKESEITVDEEVIDSKVWSVIKANGKPIIYVDSRLCGNMDIYVNDGAKPFVSINPKLSISPARNITAHCPVNMLICDSAGNVVMALEDGEACSKVTDFGSFQVYKDEIENEWVKSVFLTDDTYSVKLEGTGTGTMVVSKQVFDADGTFSQWYIHDIPVTSNLKATFVEDNKKLLSIDTNGDGIEDKVYNKSDANQLNLSAKDITLKWGETYQLEASLEEVSWVSDNPIVAGVDENGVVSAVSAGTATITAAVKDGSGIQSICKVTVPKESIALTAAMVTGIQTKYEWTGEVVAPVPEIKYNGKTLNNVQDYEIEYGNNVNAGEGTIVIRGTGFFTGELRFEFTIGEPPVETVEERVDKIVKECRDAGVVSEYETALWLHDWLTANANYDYSYTYYYPNGVLLEGEGVCQSYALAYSKLLDKVGIENQVISAPEMNHAWNIVKMDGQWSHVDCTWDDPAAGGKENHNYFGLTDALMRRDHTWSGSYPSANSTQNLYIVREGKDVVEDVQSLATYLAGVASKETASFEVYYIGADSQFNIMDEFFKWFGENNWRYGLVGYSVSGNQYAITVKVTYSQPWDKPEFNEPVQGAAFELFGLDGCYQSENYNNNGVVLIFGNSTCGNTLALLEMLSEDITALRSGGVEVFLNVLDCPDDISLKASGLQETYPNFRVTCGDNNVFWENLSNVGYSGGNVGLPGVFVYNKERMITYYSLGYVNNVDALLSEAYAVATRNSVPEPSEYPQPLPTPVLGSAFSMEGPAGTYTYEQYKKNGVVVIFGYAQYQGTTNLLERLKGSVSALDEAGVEVIVSLLDCADSTALSATGLPSSYPEMEFVYGSDYAMWDMLGCVGYEGEYVNLPTVFVYNGAGMISYYSVEGVKIFDMLLDAAYEAAEDNFLLGDVTGDGKVNIKDCNRLYDHINEVNKLTGEELICADVIKDGKVNIKDWNRIYAHVIEVSPLW